MSGFAHHLPTCSDILDASCSFKEKDKKADSQSKPGARGAAYEAYKQSLVDEVMRVFNSEFPELVDSVDFVMGASPLTNNFYLGATSGEVSMIKMIPYCFIFINIFYDGVSQWFLFYGCVSDLRPGAVRAAVHHGEGLPAAQAADQEPVFVRPGDYRAPSS